MMDAPAAIDTGPRTDDPFSRFDRASRALTYLAAKNRSSVDAGLFLSVPIACMKSA
jgi:hypothetical protein